MQMLSDIINHPSFRRTAACLRPSMVVSVRRAHGDIPLASLAEYFGKISCNTSLVSSNPEQYFTALQKLADATARVSPLLVILSEDLVWLQEQIGSQNGPLVASMLAAYMSACESRFVTPRQLTDVSDVTDRTWRDRAGSIPGSIRIAKNNQWLLPASVIEVMYGLDLSGIAVADDLPSLAQADIADALRRAEAGE